MELQKLTHGVLRVITPMGPRYFRPTFPQRIYLLWIFRHFQTLPGKVLSSRQTRLMDSICASQQYLAIHFQDSPILGTLEERAPLAAENLPPRRPNATVTESLQSLATNLRHRL